MNKQKIYNFFEKPESLLAKFVQFLIVIFILISVSFVIIEYFFKAIYFQHEQFFIISEYIILAIFTIEYLLRLISSPESKWKFARKPLNIVDFVAIFPSYLELILPFVVNTTAIRSLRLIRILRFSRLLRTLKLFRYGRLLNKILKYNNTILQSITPVIILFIIIKSVIWGLEYAGLWSPNANLGELFAIIGFALGIILSQKIGVTYDKFIQIEETVVRIYSNLQSLILILNNVKGGLGTNVCKRWAKTFLEELNRKGNESQKLQQADQELHNAILQAEEKPAELAILYSDICNNAAFCLSKKVRLTPKPYDTLLHQATILYLLLIAIFIPGLTGLISVLVATYILYGMYNVTQDLDSIIGGEYDLININISELEQLANNK
ncbi:MAG: ion transporter [Parcubacteria group bacterium]|nr:ion transporter [Parcubacteria group bacterium]